MRLSSKKFDLERKESPQQSRTSESNKGTQISAGKSISKPIFGGMPGIKSEISGGFYLKNKPIKSPGSSSSSASEYIKGPKLTGTKFKGTPKDPKVSQKLNVKEPPVKKMTANQSIYDISERRSSKTGISMLKFNPNSKYAHSTDEKDNVPPPVPLPNSVLSSGGLGGLGGFGGLSKGGLGGLGRHNI